MCFPVMSTHQPYFYTNHDNSSMGCPFLYLKATVILPNSLTTWGLLECGF